jgi:hypothetical protein
MCIFTKRVEKEKKITQAERNGYIHIYAYATKDQLTNSAFYLNSSIH